LLYVFENLHLGGTGPAHRVNEFLFFDLPVKQGQGVSFLGKLRNELRGRTLYYDSHVMSSSLHIKRIEQDVDKAHRIAVECNQYDLFHCPIPRQAVLSARNRRAS